MNTTAWTYQVFLSYGAEEEDWVQDWLLPRLEAAGLRVCDPLRDFDIGVPELVNMERALESSEYTIPIMTPAWLSSGWRQVEALLIQSRDPAAAARRLLPLMLKQCQVPRRIEIITPAEFSKPERHEAQLTRIIAAIKGELNLHEVSPRSDPLSTRTTLQQLRAPVADFIGRDEELQRLALALGQAGQASARICCIRGMGGLGKTELAYALAQRIEHMVPDAQLYINMRGTGDEPLSSELALQSIIRAFDPETKLPSDLGQLRNLYYSLLDGKQVLVLADNASDLRQVRALLPPPGCILLITSRNRFSVPGMIALDLDTLPRQSAAALLLKICPRIGRDAGELAQLCGDLPLALRVSGGLLESDDTRSVPRYLASLRDSRTQLTRLRDPDDPRLDVEASLALSYETLTQPTQRVLQQLSIFPTGFDREAAHAIVDVGGDDELEEQIFGQLRRRSLLEWDEQRERYRLHDLVRVFAASRLAGHEPVALAYAQHYMQVAQRADQLYRRGGAALLEGLKTFDRERNHIDASWEWARAHPHSQESDELLMGLADATANIGDLRYASRDQRLPQLQAALEAARRQRRPQAESTLLSNLGDAYKDLGEVRSAIALYQQALELSEVAQDHEGSAAVRGQLGSAYSELGEVEKAVALYQQALETQRAAGDRAGEVVNLINLGAAYNQLSQTQRSIEIYEQALKLSRAIGDRRSEGTCLNNLGGAYTLLRDCSQAIELYQQALAIATELGNLRGKGIALGGLGVAYSTLGDTPNAIDFYYQRLEIARDTGDRRGEANACWNLGLLFEQEDDLQTAVELMQVCVRYEREIGHPNAAANAARVEQIRRRLRGSGG